MSQTEEKTHFFDNSRNLKYFINTFFGICIILICIDLFFHRHPSFSNGVFPLEEFFGFYAIYGFVACVLLVIVAKELRKILMRKEDYYDA